MGGRSKVGLLMMRSAHACVCTYVCGDRTLPRIAWQGRHTSIAGGSALAVPVPAGLSTPSACSFHSSDDGRRQAGAPHCARHPRWMEDWRPPRLSWVDRRKPMKPCCQSMSGVAQRGVATLSRRHLHTRPRPCACPAAAAAVQGLSRALAAGQSHATTRMLGTLTHRTCRPSCAPLGCLSSAADVYGLIM